MEMFYMNRDMIRCLEIVYSEEEQEDVAKHDYQIKMIEANQISYLLDLCVIHMDKVSTLRYLTEECYVFSKRFQHQHMKGPLFLDIMNQIIRCVDMMSLYLLSAENLVLNPDYMFFDEEEKCVKLVYVPGYRMNFRNQLKQLLEFLMRVFDSNDRDGIQQLYRIYSEIELETWGSDNLKRMLQTSESGKCRFDKPVLSRHQLEVQSVEVPRLINVSDGVNDAEGVVQSITMNSLVDKSTQQVKLSEKIKQLSLHQSVMLGVNVILIGVALLVYVCGGKSIFWLYLSAALVVLFAVFCAYAFAEDQENADEAMESYKRRNLGESYEKLNSYYESADDEMVHALVPLTNGTLNEIVFSDYGERIIVGRGKNETDYRLPTSEINKVHAYIHQKGGGVFLEDLESQNGTFLNSVRIPSKEIKKLNKGDIVGFASEEFFVS